MLIELDMESGEIRKTGGMAEPQPRREDRQAIAEPRLEVHLPSLKDGPVRIPRIDDIDTFLSAMSQAR